MAKFVIDYHEEMDVKSIVDGTLLAIGVIGSIGFVHDHAYPDKDEKEFGFYGNDKEKLDKIKDLVITLLLATDTTERTFNKLKQMFEAYLGTDLGVNVIVLEIPDKQFDMVMNLSI
ncbi:hypothetical protein D3C78_20020 [compost metagenome]